MSQAARVTTPETCFPLRVHTGDVLPFPETFWDSKKREARLCGGPGAAPKREARVLDDPRKGSTSLGSGATARKREARVPDEEEGVGESRAMSPQRDQLDPSSSCFPFQEISSHPSDVQPFCLTPAPRASLLHAG